MIKPIAWGLLLIAIAAVLYWLTSGANIWTQTEVQVEVVDDLFGTTTTEWQPKFQIGLEYTALIAVPSLLASLLLFRYARKR